MTRHFTLYWKWEVFERKQNGGGPIGHAASDYIDRCRVQVGDVIWVITFRDGVLQLGGRLDVGWVGNRAEAARRLATTPNKIFSRRTHVLSAEGTDQPARLIELAPLASSLRFIGGRDRLPKNYSGKNFQRMRVLAPASVALLERLWSGAATPSRAPFDPSTFGDTRERIELAITLRRGQPQFRAALLTAYEARCAITGCDAVEALEAAHIVPYSGVESDDIRNGLLLRADVHTLFDRHLVTVDPETLTVLLAPALRSTTYAELHGRRLRVPADPNSRPSQEALEQHRSETGLRLD